MMEFMSVLLAQIGSWAKACEKQELDSVRASGQFALVQDARVNSLFARAEKAFVAGKLDSAQSDLLQVQRLSGPHPAVLHLLALVHKKAGRSQAAREAFEGALRLSPEDPQINNNYANLLNEIGKGETALLHYDRALAAAPAFHDARYNRALLLQRVGQLEEALSDLDVVTAAGPRTAKFHSSRGSVLRALHRLDEAAEAYDRAIELEPQRLVARHGRALVAKEQGDGTGSELYRRALALKPDDPELVLGLAEALESEGRPGAAEALAAAVAAEPQWIAGQAALARMRWEAGEGTAFTRGMELGLKRNPANRDLWFAYASALADADLAAQAADAAAAARAAAGEDDTLHLLEALQASEAGQLERAERLYAELSPGMPGRSIHETRHRIRCQDYGRALDLVEKARVETPRDIGVWAMTGIIWRLAGDPRWDWLLDQPGFIRTGELDLAPGQIVEIAERLRSLHRTRAHPIGQSLRGGTQTRGRLFNRTEPEILLLRDVLTETVRRYWSELPPPDEAHPLLRHRGSSPKFEGSWSVRLTGGGFHISHMHPSGLLSSACYFAVPEEQAPQEGWLEIGGPPEGLDIPLEPLLRVEPAPGRLALFPSFCYHGTRPFPEGERLSVAFDIVAS
jgi:tetratricopeptide (TPR) repeat protein